LGAEKILQLAELDLYVRELMKNIQGTQIGTYQVMLESQRQKNNDSSNWQNQELSSNKLIITDASGVGQI
jgi:hypothetical protein